MNLTNFWRFFLKPNAIKLRQVDDFMSKYPDVSRGSSLSNKYLEHGGTQVEVSLHGSSAFRMMMRWAHSNSLQLANDSTGPFFLANEYEQMVYDSVLLDQALFAANLRPPGSASTLTADQVVAIDRTVVILHHVVWRLVNWKDLVPRMSDLMAAFCEIAMDARREGNWIGPGNKAPADLLSVKQIIDGLVEVAPLLAAINKS